jgi:hypothetical protein
MRKIEVSRMATHCKRGHDLTLDGARRVQDNRCRACYEAKYPTRRGSQEWRAKVEAGREGTAFGARLGNTNAQREICRAGLHDMATNRKVVGVKKNGKRQVQCHACLKERMRIYKHDNVARYSERRTAHERKKKYGVSPVDYAEMLVKQNGVCAICKGLNRDGRSLALDHCHQTGKKRGLLCGRCNLTLGRVEDDVEILWGMIQYLENRGSVH